MDAHAEKIFGCLVKGIDEAKRQVTGIASVDTVDRDGEIISLAAVKDALAGYLVNPVVLAAHSHKTTTGDSTVVGHVVKAWVDESNGPKRGLNIVVQFADTDLGEQYWKLYAGKHQRAFSIGFAPKEYDRHAKPPVINKLELYEISCVPVPSNRESLVKSRKEKRKDFIQAKRFDKLLAALDEESCDKSLYLYEQLDRWREMGPEEREKQFSERERIELGELDEKQDRDSDEFIKAIFEGELTEEEKRLGMDLEGQADQEETDPARAYLKTLWGNDEKWAGYQRWKQTPENLRRHIRLSPAEADYFAQVEKYEDWRGSRDNRGLSESERKSFKANEARTATDLLDLVKSKYRR